MNFLSAITYTHEIRAGVGGIHGSVGVSVTAHRFEGEPEIGYSNWMVLDTETTVHKGMSPSAFGGNSQLLLIGVLFSDKKRIGVSTIPVPKMEVCSPMPYDVTEYADNPQPLLLIGANIKFDLHHMRMRNIGGSLLKPDVMLWDVSLAHYLLTGQRDKMPSLVTACSRYATSGSTYLTRKDVLKDNMEAGVMPQDMPPDELRRYLRNDLYMTRFTAAHQINEVTSSGRMNFFLSQMRALRACIEMEWNGLRVDDVGAIDMGIEVHREVTRETKNLDTFFRKLVPTWPVTVAMPPTSGSLLTPLFYGGCLSYEEAVSAGTYKTGARAGLPKMKKETRNIVLPVPESTKGYHLLQGTTPGGSLAWDEAELTGLSKFLQDVFARTPTYECNTMINFIDTLLTVKKLNKVEGTYLLPIIKAGTRGVIHHTLHQTTTATGRLSCANPNLQNVTSFSEERLDVKKLYVTRYSGGAIIEADYKQIEVVALAIRSGDAQLIADLMAGVDIHTATGRTVFGSTMSKEQRRIVKGVNFGLIYGAGANTLAEQAGCTVQTATKLINAFFQRYPGVKTYRDAYSEDVRRHITKYGTTIRPKDSGGIPEKASTSVPDTFRDGSTGRRFYMETVHGGASPYTKACNYPIQALATGDVVPLVMGRLWQAIENDDRFRGRLLMINQVHDSLMFDCPGELLEEALVFIKTEMEKAPQLATEVLGVNFHLPLVANLSHGKNWRESSAE